MIHLFKILGQISRDGRNAGLLCDHFKLQEELATFGNSGSRGKQSPPPASIWCGLTKSILTPCHINQPFNAHICGQGYCSHVEKGRICLCKKAEWNIPGAVIICTATSDISCIPFICMSIMVSVIVVTE